MPHCWHCDEEIGPNYNYCTQCAAPVDSFRVNPGEGFLSRGSMRYLHSLINGDISYPDDPALNDDLEESLQEQLKEDTRAAMVELGGVCSADDKLLIQSIDFSAIERWADEDFDTGDIPPSFVGLFRLVDNLVNTLPSEFFELLREED